MGISKAPGWPHGWQMPVPQAAQNLLMPHLRDWQGAQMPTVAGGRGGGCRWNWTDAKLFKQNSWSCRCTLISSVSLPGVESSLSIPLASSSSSERGKNNSSQSLFFDLVCAAMLLFWWNPFTVSPFSPAFLSSWKFRLLFDGGAKSV